MVYVKWIYGRTGTGKTEMVKDLLSKKLKSGEIKPRQCALMQPVIKSLGYTLTPLYSDTKILIIDNLYDDNYSLKELLDLINGTTIHSKMKGFVRIRPEEIYITSLYKPEEIYTNADRLYKKISEIVHLE